MGLDVAARTAMRGVGNFMNGCSMLIRSYILRVCLTIHLSGKGTLRTPNLNASSSIHSAFCFFMALLVKSGTRRVCEATEDKIDWQCDLKSERDNWKCNCFSELFGPRVGVERICNIE